MMRSFNGRTNFISPARFRSFFDERVILEEKGQKRKTMRLMNGSRVADVSLSPRVTCIYARTN